MDTLLIDQLFDTLFCSYKKTFKIKSNNNLHISNIKAILNESLLNKYLISRIGDVNITLGLLNIQLNQTWNTLKKDSAIKIEIADYLAIKSKMNKIYDYLKEIKTIKEFNVPIVFDYNELSVLFNYNRYIDNNKETYLVNFNTNYIGLSRNNSILKIVYNIIYYILKEKFNKKINLVLLKLDSFTPFECEIIDKEEVIEQLSNLYKILKNKILIPRNDYYLCNKCEHNTICKWAYKQA